jgi:hypothetical protein
VRPIPFALTLGGVLLGTAVVGYAAVFLVTREEGFHRSYAWRVHLADQGRNWAVQILAPGREWENLEPVPSQFSRQSAVDLALGTIDLRT